MGKSDAGEVNPFYRKYRAGERRVALVYPNRYRGGVANTGLQYIYAAANEVGVCERFYTDVFHGLRSVETATPLSEFDVALFSLQYEEDYFKAVKILRESGFRGIKIAGGPCVMENPKPLLSFFDAFFVGEVEGQVEEIVSARSAEELEGMEGIYTGGEEKVRRVYCNLEEHMNREIIGDGAYGRCFLVEIGRGCVRRCRFCIVRQIYRPPRWRKADRIPFNDIATFAKDVTDKIVLISPSPTDHPEFLDIVQEFVNLGFTVSPSSVRADTIDEEVVEILRESGVKTITIAPETASSHLVDVIGKNIGWDDVMHAVEISSGAFDRIKLYYMIGLPGESLRDVEEITRQVEEVRRFFRKVEVSVNPLVPKPHTPLQWMAFGGKRELKDGIESLRRKIAILRKMRRRGIDVRVSPLREFLIQTILSRGDESLGRMIESGYRGYRDYLKFASEIDVEAELPWDFIDHGYRKERLVKEYLSITRE